MVNGARDDGFNNFGTNAPAADGYTNELGRIDYNISQQNRTYFNVRHTDYYQTKNDYFGNISTGSNLSRNNWGSTLDHVFIDERVQRDQRALELHAHVRRPLLAQRRTSTRPASDSPPIWAATRSTRSFPP